MKSNSWYDKEEDIFGINIDTKEKYWKSVELKNGIVVDISKNGKVVGFEIPNARKIFVGEAGKILETVKTH